MSTVYLSLMSVNLAASATGAVDRAPAFDVNAPASLQSSRVLRLDSVKAGRPVMYEITRDMMIYIPTKLDTRLSA